jgi:hypothetical protein
MSQSSSQNTSVVVIVIGIYMILLAVVLLCIGAAAVGCGGVMGGLTSFMASQSEVPSDAVTGVAVATGLATVVGIVTLVAGVASLVVAIGLFLTKPWAYMGAIVMNAIVVGLEVLNILTGTPIVVPLLVILASGAAIFFLLYDQGAKQAFGRM